MAFSSPWEQRHSSSAVPPGAKLLQRGQPPSLNPETVNDYRATLELMRELEFELAPNVVAEPKARYAEPFATSTAKRIKQLLHRLTEGEAFEYGLLR